VQPSLLVTDRAVAAQAYGPGPQSPDQRLVTFNGNAEVFQQGHAVGKDGDIRGGAADVQRHGVFVAFGHAEDAHDTGRRPGEDGLDGRIGGFGHVERSPVGLEDIDRDFDALAPHELKDVVYKALVALPDGAVEVGGIDAAPEIQVPRHAVPQGHVAEIIRQESGRPQLLGGVAGGEFAHDAQVLDPLPPELFPHRLYLFLVNIGGDHSPVVDVTGDMKGVGNPGKERWRQAGTAGDHHSHPFHLALDNSVGGEGGAEDYPLQLLWIFPGEDLRCHPEQGVEEMGCVRRNLGLFSDFESFDQNRIRMRSAYVNA